ncbi:MAG: hypothetical protein H7A23_05605 [Leptospiraceae bacterium]|nr:hypothetical protein [Leptospiraceae bacterium]MCP5494013.1 hypothetical protein [Leptospiraceae bacterium]
MFLNSTAHALTPEQKQKAIVYSDTIIDLKDDEPSLYERLTNCPAEITELNQLCNDYLQYLENLYTRLNGDIVLHFPIGSPVFNALFFLHLNREKFQIRIVFSHTERVSVDERQPDGSIIKRAVFKFVKFIEI